MQIFEVGTVALEKQGLCSEDCIPNRRRSYVFQTQAAEGELVLANTVKQFDVGDRNGCAIKLLKPRMDLVLDLIPRWSCSIRLFRYFDDRSLVSSTPCFRPTSRVCPVRRGIAIQSDDDRSAPFCAKRFAEKRLLDAVLHFPAAAVELLV